jgi:putative methionine-R-sulfoxide reductase with GAF domain
MNTRNLTMTPGNKKSLRGVLKEQIAEIEYDLEKVRDEVGADILAFYLAGDPFLPNNLRCLAAPGAVYPEACSHFRLRPHAAEEPRIRFFPQARDDGLRSGNDPRVEELIRKRQDPIFGDFITRERIESRGRLIERDPESNLENALLTVNFCSPVNPSEWERIAGRISESFDSLLTRTLGIRDGLQKLSDDLCPSFLRMLEIIDPLQAEPKWSLREQLRIILEQTIRTLDDDTSRWCGTIHLLDESKKDLVLAASVGDFHLPSKTTHRIDEGEGVISWVALRKQAIRIRDLESSTFRHIHVEYLPRVQSQLAVPIMTHNRLLGTLSLEAPEPDLFCLHWIGYLTRVASLVATAVFHSDYERVSEERRWYRAAIYERERSRKDRPFENLSLADLDSMSVGPVDMLE